MPFNHKDMTEEECYQIEAIIQPGDVILTATRGEFSNVFLEYWSHGMIFSKSGLWEATTKGVRKSHIMYALGRKDDVIILRPRFKLDLNRMDAFCKYAEGTAYDYGFESSAEELYCFELVADALIAGHSGDVDKPHPEIVSCKKTLLGEKYLASCFLNEKYEIVWKRSR